MADEKKVLKTNDEIDDAILYFFKDFHDSIQEKDLINLLHWDYHISDDTQIKRSLGRLWARDCLYRREDPLNRVYYRRKAGVKSKREIEENKNKIFLFTLICGQDDYEFYFDPENPFNYKGTLSTQASHTYSGTYHPESYTYTGISVGGVAAGEVKKNDAYVKSHQTYNGKGNLTYNEKVVDCVILDSKLVPFAVEAGILVSDQGIIKLRSDFTQSDLNTVMSNMGMGAYSQINLANLSAEKAPTMSNCSKIFQFLNKVMGGVFTPEAAEARKKQNKTNAIILFSVAAAIVLFFAIIICAVC